MAEEEEIDTEQVEELVSIRELLTMVVVSFFGLFFTIAGLISTILSIVFVSWIVLIVSTAFFSLGVVLLVYISIWYRMLPV